MFQTTKDTILDRVLSLLNTPLHDHAIEMMESVNKAIDEFESNQSITMMESINQAINEFEKIAELIGE